MITKLPHLRLSRTISLTAYISPLPHLHTNDHNLSEYDANIQSLKNNPHPETLINVLSSTHDLNSCIRLFKWASLQNEFHHTVDTYHHIIARLGLASRVDEMEGFCNAMVLASGISASQQVMLSLLTLVDSFITNRKFDEAFRVFSLLVSFDYKPSIAVVNRLLGVIVEERRGFESVVFVYKEMVKARVCPTVETLNHLMQALFDAGRIDSAVDQYKRMRKKGCCPNSRTYEIMVIGLIRKNRLDKAVAVLHELLESGCDFEPEVFSRVIPLLFNMNQHNIGIRLFEKMGNSNSVLDFAVYEALLQYFSRNQFMDDATISFLNDLKASEGDLVHGFRELSEGKRFLEDQQVTGANSYSVLLKGYCEAGDYARAVDVFCYIYLNKLPIHASSFSMLIEGLCRKGKVNKVINSPPVAAASSCGLYCCNEDYYSVIMKNLSKFDNLLTIVGRMVVEGCPLNSETYNRIIETTTEHERSTECAAFLNQMVNEGLFPDTEIFTNSVSFLAKKLRVHLVLPAIHKLLSVSERRVLNHGICDILINGLWNEGYKCEARLVLDTILEQGWVPDPATHRLFVGSGCSEQVDAQEDEITNILSDSLN